MMKIGSIYRLDFMWSENIKVGWVAKGAKDCFSFEEYVLPTRADLLFY